MSSKTRTAPATTPSASRASRHQRCSSSLQPPPEVLRQFEEQSFEDIGREMHLPMNTAKTRYYRGLKSLESKLRTRAQELLP